MKRGISFRKSTTYLVLSILVSFILIFSLLPHDVLAKTYHVDLKLPEKTAASPSQVDLTKAVPSMVKESNSEDDKVSDPSSVMPPGDSLPPPEQVIKYLVPSDNDTEIKSPTGKVTLKIPKGAASSNLRVDFAERAPFYSPTHTMLRSFSLNARTLGPASENITRFSKELEISIKHSQEELNSVNPDSLRLYYVDTKTNKWVPVPTSKFDARTRILTAKLNHFTEFSEQADPLVIGPGRIMSTQVNLNSGTATFSYPIELPPGPGKFAPKLELIYNSGVADGMKNKRAMGSWVGIGWTLHLGRISYSYDEKEYSLELNNASHRLIPINAEGTLFRTEIDDYFKIGINGNAWEVIDRDGTYYRFGGTADARQPLPPGGSFRWHLDLIQDTNGNQATATYIKNINHSCYPEYLNYGNTQVHFVSSFNRPDNPIDYCWTPQYCTSATTNEAPIVREDKRLDLIEIKTNGTLIRRYDFTYNTTNCVFSTDYNGIYYSGKHTLTSLTQVGADGASNMPALTFGYEDLATYFYYRPSSGGIPPQDNPATFHWPHLTSIDSGYGGEINFEYAPTTGTAVDIWTRQVVVGKTVNGGISTEENSTYAYTGGPRYDFGEYLGFDEVKVTDADGNYQRHYFYTDHVVNGKAGEAFSGREYRTRWYDSANNLLREVNNDFYTGISNMQMAGASIKSYIYWEIPCSGYPPSQDPCFAYMISTTSVALLNNYVFITDAGANSVHLFKKSLKWGIYGYETDWLFDFGAWLVTPGDPPVYDGISNPHGIAVSVDNYVYVSDTGGKRIVVFDSNGTKVNAFTYSWQSGQYEGYPVYDYIDPHGLCFSPDGRIYVTDTSHNRVVIFNSAGSYTGQLASLSQPRGVAVAPDGYVYVADTGNNRIAVFDSAGNYVRQWGSLSGPQGVAIAPDGNVYVSDTGNNRIAIFDSQGNYIRQFYGSMSAPQGLLVTKDNYVYVADTGNAAVDVYEGLPRVVHLVKTEEAMGAKTSRTRYAYDSYGNVQTEYHDGDITTNNDDSTIQRAFYPNTTSNILNRPGRERVYFSTDNFSDSNIRKESCYYYDSSDNYATPPADGNLTRILQKKDASNSVSTYYTYDTYGNRLTTQDPNGNVTAMTYDSTNHIYPRTKVFPESGMSESYTYDPGTYRLLSQTDVNGQITSYQYDTFKRLTKVIKPGDSATSPSIEYQYNDWSILGQQNVKTITKISGDDFTWESKYFDGLGRVLQTQSKGETDRTIISSTTTYNDCGQVEKQYITQDFVSSSINGYKAPEASWRYSSSIYDALGRVTTLSNADNTTVNYDYSVPWREVVTNEKGIKKRYYYDAFKRLLQVDERDGADTSYALTNYQYDVLGNLVLVRDALSNNTTMSYDWLSRKTAMTDPDMGSWSYSYDNNGNLVGQTDAKGQAVTMAYDSMNRITGKSYPAGSGMTNVTYSYDDTGSGTPEEWQHDENLGTVGQSTFLKDISGLIPNTTYYYKCAAVTPQGTIWAESASTFNTGGIPSIPAVTNSSGASNIAPFSARLNGAISGNCGETPVVHICWGDNDAGTNPADWDHDENLGLQGTGGFYKNVSGLSDNITYYYRCYAVNSAGTGFAASTASFTAQDWLDGWDYRKKITINGTTAGAQSNYALKLTVYYGNGLDMNGTVYCNSKCKADFSDLKFTKSDGSTPIDYWLESKTDSNNAIVWVEFDAIPASPGTASFYMYYGNSGASSASTKNALIFAEDFDGGFDNTWTGSGWSRSDTGGYNNTGAYSGSNLTNTSVSYPRGVKLSFSAYLLEFTGSWGGGMYFISGGDAFLVQLVPESDEIVYYHDGGQDNIDTPIAGGWYKTDIWVDDNGSVKIYLNDVLKHTDSTTLSTFTGLSIYSYITGYKWDNIYLRKCIAVEPTWGYWGIEEAYGGTATTTLTNASGATAIASHSARLNGNISSTGGEDPVAHICWGDNDAGTTIANWDHDENLGIKSAGAFYKDMTMLSDNMTYYYRCYAVNSAGTAFAPGTSMFTTRWLDGWSYRKQVAINGSTAGVQTNYQMKLSINFGNGIDSGGAVYLNSRCKADFSDIRFTKLDSLNLLDYWVESYTAGSSAVVWIEFDSLPADPAVAGFYVYYGNPGATSLSNGTNTFIFFDDFERGNNGEDVGGSWTIVQGDVNISDIRAYSGSRSALFVPGSPWPKITSSTAPTSDTAIRVRFYKEAATGSFYPLVQGNDTHFIDVKATVDGSIYNAETYDTGADSTNDAWNVIEANDIDWTNHNFDIWLNSSKIYDDAPMVASAGYNGLKGLVCTEGTSGDEVWADTYIIRRWAAGEPAWGTWGSEETRSLWLNGWGYRKQLNITGSTSGAQTNYQMKLNINFGSGTVYLNSRCNTDFSDLRFTGTDGVTLLDYWVESCTPSTAAAVWLEFNSLPAGPTVAGFYIYYGNPGVSNLSNGSNTFAFFDDFERGNNGDDVGGSWTTVQGDVNLSGTKFYRHDKSALFVPGSPYPKITSPSPTPSSNSAIRVHFYKEAATTAYYPLVHGNGTYMIDVCVIQDGSVYYSETHDTDANSTNDTWNVIEANDINWTNHTFDIWLNGVKIFNDAPMIATAAYNGQVSMLCTEGTAGDEVWADAYFIRRWAATEPTWSTCGSEETAPSPEIVITNASGATNIGYYNARLNGELVSPVSENITVHIYWGTSGGNFGKGKRTGMTDALGTTNYVYDARGRLIEEKRAIDSSDYITKYRYDGADRLIRVTYPSGENITQTYNGRGLPYGLSGDVAENLVSSTLYNQLGQVSEINLGNGLRTTFGYWGVGGTYDNSGGYYGKLWEIKTIKQPGGSPVLQDVQHTWDAGGNLSQRRDVLTSENETFQYDFLDRLTGVSGPYTETFTYNQIGNIMTKNGASYTYGAKPHAATAVGATNYVYDANGNMTNRGAQVLTWDVENRPISVSEGGTTSTFVYDGDGKRVKKTEGGQTIIYVNQYYEKNVTTSVETSNYYLGSRIIAQKKGTVLQYLHQDHLTGTSLSSDGSGNLVSTIKYFSFGAARSGNVNTDIKFTGQRLDGTGLYYYGARYYDPQIGRFLSADSLVQIDPRKTDMQLSLAVSYCETSILAKYGQAIRENEYSRDGPLDPQFLNRYSHARNNPLKYNDSSGHCVWIIAGAVIGAAIGLGIYAATHQDNFNWGEAAVWAGGGALIGGTLGLGAGYVAGTATATAIVSTGTTIGTTVSVWAMKALERGQAIHKLLGQNLVPNFPGIDKWENGVVTSIKSIDLAAKSYQNINTLMSTIKGYVSELASFKGFEWANVNIKESAIANRVLQLAVPPSMTEAQAQTLQYLTEWASCMGVQLTITVIP